MTHHRVAGYQAGLTAISSALAYMLVNGAGAKAVLFGGAIALVNTLMLSWRIRKSMQQPDLSPHQELGRLYRSSMERFFVVALLLAAGLGWLKLMPAPLLVGFILGQLTLIVLPIINGIEK